MEEEVEPHPVRPGRPRSAPSRRSDGRKNWTYEPIPDARPTPSSSAGEDESVVVQPSDRVDGELYVEREVVFARAGRGLEVDGVGLSGHGGGIEGRGSGEKGEGGRGKEGEGEDVALTEW